MSELKNNISILNNLLNDVRINLFNKFKSLKLKDRYGNKWEITKIEFEENFTIIRLGNKGTDDYSAIVLKNPQNEGDTDDLSEWEFVNY